MMKDDDFKLFRGYVDRQMDKQTDICDHRVKDSTENIHNQKGQQQVKTLSAEERNDLLPSKF